MFTRKFTIGFVILFLMAAGSYYSMVYLTSKKKLPEPPQEKKSIPLVKAKEIVYSNIAVSVEKQGRLSSNHKVEIITEVQGKILAGDLPLKVGQSFKKGQVLFQVYDEESKLALRAAKSRFLTIVANVLPDIKYDFDQNYKAWQDFFNAIDINQPLPKLPVSKSEQEKIYVASKNIFNDYYTIQSSEIKLTKHTIVAPFNGSFSQVLLQEGSIANPGTRIATIIRTDLLELEVSVEVNLVKWIEHDQSVELSMGNEVIAHGKVSRISDFVDTKTQSVLVYVSVPNTQKIRLYEGMYLKARFHGFQLQNVMKIPRSAVFNVDEVYLVENNTLLKTRVNVLKVDQEFLYFNGPNQGKAIAIELPLVASDGLEVREQLMN